MTLAERYAKMDARERKLLNGLFVALGLILFFVVPFYLHQSVSKQRDENQEIRDFLEKVTESRTKIDRLKAQREVQQERYAHAMPALATFVEEAAKSGGMEIEESGSKPDVPHGKKYVEHVFTMKLRKVGLVALVKTFEKIEKSTHPVAITRLNLKPRADGLDSYDAEVFISAFESKDAPKKEQPAKEEEPEEEETP